MNPLLFRSLSACVLALAVVSCATSTPRPVVVVPLSVAVTSADRVHTTVNTVDGRMPEIERQMLAERITQRVQSLAQPGMGAGRSYELVVTITRYARGNGIARTLLPGTGQIHLDGVVTVYRIPGKARVGEFILNKAFIVGGLYGVSIGMNTIANTYAQAVAEAVCQWR